MTTAITSRRLIRVSVLFCLFGYLCSGPNAFINDTRFSDLAPAQQVLAQAGSRYTYTVIANVSNCINVGPPVLNNKGQVAFAAGKCTGPFSGFVRRGDGGALTDIYTNGLSSTFSLPENVISINDSGTVAFPVNTITAPFRYGILAGDGGPTNTIVDSSMHSQYVGVRRPSINNSGAIAFLADTAGTSQGYDTIVVASGGSFTTIAGPGTATPNIGPLVGVGTVEPALNNNGVVAFIGQGASNFGLFKGSGGPLTAITVTNPASFDMNDLGRVAVVGSNGLQLVDGAVVKTVAWFDIFQPGYFLTPSVNNADVVSFAARLNSGPYGEYTGPNLATDTVFQSGGVFSGCGTVTSTESGKEAINDEGQVAFVIRCNVGGLISALILRADPVATPTTTTLTVAPSQGAAGQPVTLTATVAATAGVPSGQVDFYDGATLLGTATLVNGVASFQTTALTLGSHSLSAVFRGGSGFLTSTSPTVTFVVVAVQTVQPPSELRASAINGNLVTLRWTTSSAGPRPTNFVIEGGVTPGDVRGAIATNSAFPIATIAAPSGAFYVRVHALAGSERSGPSNEIRIFVNVPAAPSAPANLTALVNGSSLALTWLPTFTGGAATSHVLNVTGAVNTSMPLSDANGFSFSGVPAGTYTMSVSASNAAGTSVPSNAVTLTFPGPCSGAPLTPANFLAYRVGNIVTVVWDPPASGPAAARYVLNVTGAFAGSFTTTGLSFSGAAGAGSYGLSVLAANACGSSTPTLVQTITLP